MANILDSAADLTQNASGVVDTIQDVQAGGQRAMNAVNNAVGQGQGILSFAWDAITGFAGGILKAPFNLLGSAFNGIISNGLILGGVGAFLTYAAPDLLGKIAGLVGITPEDLIEFRRAHGEWAMVGAGAAGGAALGGAVSVLSDVVGGIFGGGGLTGPASSSGDAVGKTAANLAVVAGTVALGAVLLGKDKDLLKSLGISGGEDVAAATPPAPAAAPAPVVQPAAPAPAPGK